MTTVGVDLAAEPAKTAMAVVTWTTKSARVVKLATGISDSDIVAAAAGATRIGIDAPFGWPEAFVDFVAGHHAHRPLAGPLETRDQRRPLAKRLTDLVVQQRSGVVPMSVSADRIAHVALRCVGILAALNVADRVDGVAVEAYPAAALKHWGLQNRGYKGSAAGGFDDLVTAFTTATPWLDFGEFDGMWRESDDAFDAVIAALIARAAALGRTALPDGPERDVASREGWIHVPTGPLDDLLGPRISS
ncbi:DUF429 domain-containing protein [Antrihabitans cavernicola]|uniref:DUF429 domain-containing protein n=1 Tax=Antrihabitans cavernicola TaxID=2495913 RepID=A0A5A7SE80_9NOCA|nr:DUF429 domain-containing protein [Spelaeibacter cavernicola]KAA0023699.1 DUF429 domain-containing protein [Spelaeibacter cavernicola]